MFKGVCTVLLVSSGILESELGRLAGGGVQWRLVPREAGTVVVLGGGDDESQLAVYKGLADRFGTPLVREGDIDYPSLLVSAFREAGFTLATAESCTGGLIAKMITDVAGSSDVFWGGFVTYSNDAKMRLLDIPSEVIELHGAVSGDTVRAMARGAMKFARTGGAVAVSGVAGPGGGSQEKPVGTVWIGAALASGADRAEKFTFPGARGKVRLLSAYTALFMMESLVLRGNSIDIRFPYEYI